MLSQDATRPQLQNRTYRINTFKDVLSSFNSAQKLGPRYLELNRKTF